MPVSPTRTGILTSASVWVLFAALILLPPVVIYARKGTAVLFTIVSLVLLVDWILRRRPLPPVSLGEWALMAFVAFAALSSAWSLKPEESLGTAISFAVTMAGACLIVRYLDHLSQANSDLLVRAIVIGGMIGYTCLAIEYATTGSLRRLIWTTIGMKIETSHSIIFFKPAVAIGALYLWPWALALFRTLPRVYAGSMVFVATVLILIYQTDAAIVALAIGIGVVILLLLLKQRTSHTLAIFLAVLVLAMPWIARHLPDPTLPGSHLGALPNSALHRVDIWRTTGRISGESPITGIGFDGSRMLFGGETSRVVYFLPDAPNGGFGVLSEPIPLHPHNATLQIWLETGLVGALLFAVFLISVQSRLLQSDTLAKRAAGIGFFISALVIANISFGAWQSWWLCSLLFLSAAMALVLRKDVPSGT